MCGRFPPSEPPAGSAATKGHARSRGRRPLHQPLLAASSRPTDETCWPPEGPCVAQEALQGTLSRGHISRHQAPEARRMPYASFWGVFGVFGGSSRLVWAAISRTERLELT